MNVKTLLLIGGSAALVALGAGQAFAQDRATPKNFDYEIVNGKRVPKAKRQVNADGTWREERKVGNCTEVKEKTADGAVKISRTCDGPKG